MTRQLKVFYTASLFFLIAINPPVTRAAEDVHKSTETLSRNEAFKNRLEGIFTNFLQREITVESLKRRLFPVRFDGKNVQLWEKPGILMAQAPRVSMKISTLKTMISRRFRIHRIKFYDAVAYLRFDHEGKNNITDMVKDLVRHANEIRKPGQRQKAVYHIFDIKNAMLQVIDTDLGKQPFGAPFKVNGRGTIQGLGPQTRFPFKVEAALQSSTEPMKVLLTGTMSNRPIVKITGKKIPITALTSYLPVVQWFKGSVESEFNFSKAGSYIFWKLKFVAQEIKTVVAAPFPSIKVEGLFHAFTPSVLKVSLVGKPTKIEAVLKNLDWKTKRLKLDITSKRADIQECIDWCQTGYFLSKDPSVLLEGGIKPSSSTAVWSASGKANLEGHFSSVMGPRLVKDVDGTIDLKVSDGVLSEMPGFVKTLTMLNLSSLLTAENHARGLEFETIVGHVVIKNGIAKTRNWIVLESKTLDVSVIGQVDFVHRIIDARMLVGIVSVPEDVIKKIPLVRRFTADKKHGVIPIYLSIQGRFENPDIQMISLKNLARDQWKILPKRYQLPETVEREIYK